MCDVVLVDGQVVKRERSIGCWCNLSSVYAEGIRKEAYKEFGRAIFERFEQKVSEDPLTREVTVTVTLRRW